MEHYRARSGSYRHRPFRRPFSSTGAYRRCFAATNEQKSFKNSTHLQRQALLAKQASPVCVAIRRDLFVFPYPKSQTNTQITRDSEHRRGKPSEQHGLGAAEGCSFGVFVARFELQNTTLGETSGFAVCGMGAARGNLQEGVLYNMSIPGL